MSYYTINEDAARLSKELSSFSDYKAGSATASYRAQVDEAAATLERSRRFASPNPSATAPSIFSTATPPRWRRPSTVTTRSAPAARP